MEEKIIDSLIKAEKSKIILVVIDGVGGLALPGGKGTELQIANTPNLDALATESSCGLLEPIGAGITPGSGPAHLALFGYDPIKNNMGRGILSALGTGFNLTSDDVAARVNFATVDEKGRVLDRRAGRIKTELNKKLCEKILKNIKLDPSIKFFLYPEKDYRAVLILRGDDLWGDLVDTDPQKIGVVPLQPKATNTRSKKTAKIVSDFISQVRIILADEKLANMILLRGFDKYIPFKSIKERYSLKALAIAEYPMYKGMAKLLGMEIAKNISGLDSQIEALKKNYDKYDFFFFHIKKTDSFGEDGDFDAKVKEIEKVDAMIPKIVELNPDVLVVTSDHSTPALLRYHSWHPVPVVIKSIYARKDSVTKFDEISCANGILGLKPTTDLMPLALACANRLKKFGA
ncbi:MAG: 2,3-bisphosphoglycerate-independent phosphoglycerate mutase [Actinomycetota bacterium]